MINERLLYNYFHNLINGFFKILPMKENDEPHIDLYMESLQRELIGCKNFLGDDVNDPLIVSLISILQYMIDYPDCGIPVVRKEVFRSITICQKLRDKYASGGGRNE